MKRTFFALQVSPGSRASFFRFFGDPSEEDEEDEKVRSTSHIETSTSFPTRANVVADGPLDERAMSGDGTVRPCAGSVVMEGCNTS